MGHRGERHAAKHKLSFIAEKRRFGNSKRFGMTIKFVFLFSRQGKLRLAKWFNSYPEKDNKLLTLEIIHHFVELLDLYFGSVCELDIIYNYEKAFFSLDRIRTFGKCPKHPFAGL